MITQREIKNLKLTRAQEEEILDPDRWPPGCQITREGKLDIGKEALLAERKGVLRGFEDRTIEKLQRRVSELERALDSLPETIGKGVAHYFRDELKRRCIMTFKGVWASEATYERGNVTTHAGSLFCAIDTCKGSVPDTAGAASARHAIASDRRRERE